MALLFVSILLMIPHPIFLQYSIPTQGEDFYFESDPDCPNRYRDCYVFPPDDEWNRPIDTDPVDFMSDCYVEEQMEGHDVHIDMWPGLEDYGIPYVFTTSTSHESTIEYGCEGGDYSDESDPGPFRIPLNAPIEGGSTADPNPGSGDRHLLAINLDTCELFETFYTTRTSSGFCCSSSAFFDLNVANNVRPDGWTSADAAGLPIFPGLIRYEEATRDDIKHALRFTLPSAPRSYVFPGNHFGPNENERYPPYGTRFRLKADFDETQFAVPEALAIIRALKKYGMYYSDQGSAMYIQGMGHPDLQDAIDEIHGIGIPGDAFEAVQSPYDILYDWTVTPSCNGESSKTDPGWRPSPPPRRCDIHSPEQKTAVIAVSVAVGVSAVILAVVAFVIVLVCAFVRRRTEGDGK